MGLAREKKQKKKKKAKINHFFPSQGIKRY